MATGNVFPKVTGDTIFAEDYNGVVAIMTAVLGQNATGYGIAPRSTNLAVAGRIQASAWDNLRLDLDQIQKHQNNSTSGLVDENAGDTVRASDVTSYYGCAVASYINKDKINGVDVAFTSGVASSYAVAWSGRIRQVVTLNFASQTTMTNFFNAGGNIRVSTSASGATTASKDANWNTLISSLGLHYFTATDFRAAGIPGNVSIKGPTYGTGVYATNYYQAWAETSTTSVKVTTLFNDSSIASASSALKQPPILNISPAWQGKTTWDLTVDGDLVLTTPGDYTVTSATSGNCAVYMWGGGGGGAYYDATASGANGGYAAGTLFMVSGYSYTITVAGGGGGGKNPVGGTGGTGASGLIYGGGGGGGGNTGGNGGYGGGGGGGGTFASGYGAAGGGGGASALFQGTTKSNSNVVLVAGGGGGAMWRNLSSAGGGGGATGGSSSGVAGAGGGSTGPGYGGLANGAGAGNGLTGAAGLGGGGGGDGSNGAGGGGGGGFFGGGGGGGGATGAGGAGAGGSGFANNGYVFFSALVINNGVTATYTDNTKKPAGVAQGGIGQAYDGAGTGAGTNGGNGAVVFSVLPGIQGANSTPSTVFDENITLFITSSVDYYKSANNVIAPTPSSVLLTNTLSPG